MNHYEGEGRDASEKNDCSVIALANAFNIPYPEAYGICERKGRKKNKVFSLLKVLDIGSTFYRGRFVEYKWRPKMIVKTFLKKHPHGIYIVCASRHAFVVKDGQMINNQSTTGRVRQYWKITERLTDEA